MWPMRETPKFCWPCRELILRYSFGSVLILTCRYLHFYKCSDKVCFHPDTCEITVIVDRVLKTNCLSVCIKVELRKLAWTLLLLLINFIWPAYYYYWSLSYNTAPCSFWASYVFRAFIFNVSIKPLTSDMDYRIFNICVLPCCLRLHAGGQSRVYSLIQICVRVCTEFETKVLTACLLAFYWHFFILFF